METLISGYASFMALLQFSLTRAGIFSAEMKQLQYSVGHAGQLTKWLAEMFQACVVVEEVSTTISNHAHVLQQFC